MKHEVKARHVTSKGSKPQYDLEQLVITCSCGLDWNVTEPENEEISLCAIMMDHKLNVLLEAAGIEFDITMLEPRVEEE